MIHITPVARKIYFDIYIILLSNEIKEYIK